jgi:N utilization substance protein B
MRAKSIIKPRPRSGSKTRRHRSRELALQGLYQWRVAGGSAETIEAQLHESEQYDRADKEYLSGLLCGVLTNMPELERHLQPYLDRPARELSPVEISILLLGAHELANHPEMPYRVVINEAVELAKTYGGIDGHKYVNGVLDKLAGRLRTVEINAQA